MSIQPSTSPAADVAEARIITEEVRAALAAHARTGVVLARTVQRAHASRAWLALGHPTWEAYARAEFGISRASAYRLLDMAVVLEQLTAAAAELGLSPLGDTLEITRQQARQIKGRVPEVAAVLAALLADRSDPAGASEIAELLAAAVDEVRRTPVGDVPALPASDGGSDELLRRHLGEDYAELVAAGRQLVRELRTAQQQAGALHLELAPAHLSDREAARVLGAAHGCGPESDEVAEMLAERRYAMTGDRRAIEAWEAEAFAG